MGRQCVKCGYICGDTDVVCARCGVILGQQPPWQPPVNPYAALPPYMPYAPYPPGYYPPYVPPVNNRMAVASMVLGIYSTVFGVFCGWLITSILAVVLGFVSLNSINNSYGRQKGRGMAVAGIICGFVGIAIYVCYIAVMATSGTSIFGSYSD